MLEFNFEIYEVDGIRGTLKELADYYNVDPISLSDLMLDGMSITDAICMAEKGNNPGITKKRRPKGSKSVTKVAIPVDTVVKVDKEDEKFAVESHPSIEIKDHSAWTTNSISDVQEFDSYVVITTTTTTVYRKEK